MLVFKEFKKINFRNEISLQDKNDFDYLRNLKDTISICHCRGHDTILIGIYFKGWEFSYVRLLSQKIYCS